MANPELIAGKYEVLEVIGRGGMGTVYKAHQRNLDRIVAVKMLSAELASDADFRARFQQEATVVAKMSHPNIVAVYDIEPHNGTFCIIMEYLEGETLQVKINRLGIVPEREAVSVTAQIARALHFAHSYGIIHRDVKPDNIHVSASGTAKIMDFGIARFRDSKLRTQSGISMGTPKFMSPEQVTGKNIDLQTDLYALGICLYYCLTGRVPFDGENPIAVATAHLYQAPPTPSTINTAIPPALERVVLKALEKAKENRYATGLEMAEELEAALTGKSPVRIAVDVVPENLGAENTRRMPVRRLDGESPTVLTDSSGGVTPAPSGTPAHKPIPDTGEGSSPALPMPPPPPTASLPKLDYLEDFQFRPGAKGTGRFQSAGFDFKRYWPIAVAAVLIGSALLLAIVETGEKPETPDRVEPGPGRTPDVEAEFASLLQEGARLVGEGDDSAALELWRDFQQKYPDFIKARIGDPVDLLTARLDERKPAHSEILARRRETKAKDFLTSASRYPLAEAYFRGALKLDSSRSRVIGQQLQLLNLSSGTPPSVVPRPGAARDAEQMHQRARQLLEHGPPHFNPEIPQRLMDAIHLDPRNVQYWQELADYYDRHLFKDDAAVVGDFARLLTE